ncbi:MAG: TIGR03364 family FAD-dependent oxidoreductase [Burkholderiaceae bacterium]|nr:TIGR03364 family FAD-dependent oxidoreductase [Burkholderiaceae bacterium]
MKHGKRIAIVGAGILGLAHAWAAARRGHQVQVFERDAQAVGASVRNFGLGLLLGQPQGELLDLARRSRQLWLELLPAIGAWHKAQGSLIVARDAAQWSVLQAFHAAAGAYYGTQLLNAAQVQSHDGAPGLRGLGALYSPQEIALESRLAIPAFASWLAEQHGVRFHFDTLVREAALPQLHTSRGVFEADELIVCSGHEYQQLYPEAFAPRGLRRCSLQMLRLEASGLHLGPALLTGLSALHYPSFTGLPALQAPLAALQAHVQATQPDVLAHGIHLIVQQVGLGGELIVGDSHHYGATPSPFLADAVDALLLGEVQGLLRRPLRVLERWQGVYGSGPRPYEAFSPEAGVHCMAMGSGIGMSIGLALAERHFETNG